MISQKFNFLQIAAILGIKPYTVGGARSPDECDESEE